MLNLSTKYKFMEGIKDAHLPNLKSSIRAGVSLHYKLFTQRRLTNILLVEEGPYSIQFSVRASQLKYKAL